VLPAPAPSSRRPQRGSALASSNRYSTVEIGSWREGEQDVSRPQTERAVARADVEHAAGDDGRGTVHRAALRAQTVDSHEVAVRVERPDDLAGLRRIRAQRAIVRRREDDAGDDG